LVKSETLGPLLAIILVIAIAILTKKPWALALGVAFAAFACEYVDSTLGMGYGTTLGAILIIFGFNPKQVVFTVLFSELLTGLSAGIMHHYVGNVNFKVTKIIDIYDVTRLGWKDAVKKRFPLDLRIAMLMALCGTAGVIVAAIVVFNIPKFYMKMYIGIVVFCMGIIILLLRSRQLNFSWPRIITIGTVAAFNKGMSGGGYGPLVTAGQILSGVGSKNAVGITSLAEGCICFFGALSYLLLAHKTVYLEMAPYIIIGALSSVPISALSVKHINEGVLKMAIAFATIVLGAFVIIKTLNLL
jgi:uncharacterized membrane protein YfcA